MSRPTLAKIAQAKNLASAGVDFSPRTGALCPWCGERARIYKTMPWEGSLRLRYHLCVNPRCVVSSIGVSIKSVEVDSVEVK